MMKIITEVAKTAKIDEKYVDMYGKYKAKIDLSIMDELKNKKDGKLVLVTAINPTPAGEGKTTVTVGLGQALSRLNKKAIIANCTGKVKTCMNKKYIFKKVVEEKK